MSTKEKGKSLSKMFHPIPLLLSIHHPIVVSCADCSPEHGPCTHHTHYLRNLPSCTLCPKPPTFFTEPNKPLLCMKHGKEIAKENIELFFDRVEEAAFQINTHITVQQFHEQVKTLIQQSGISYFMPAPQIEQNVREIATAILELRGVQEVPANVTTELGKMAHDKQNVHTQPVVKHTSKSTEILLSQTIPEEWDMRSVIESYLRRNKLVGKHKSTLKDICKWYRTRTCRTTNDKLYAKMLDGLLVIIQSHTTHKQELMKRLLEETSEAVGLCCEGHLARLANVMVGFDERFNPEVPVKEILQQKMALIAGKDIPVEAKVFEAYAVFQELKIPEEEHHAWIDAL